MLKEADAADLLGDEERAYVLYMKYFNVIQLIKKAADYKKQKVWYFDKDNIIRIVLKFKVQLQFSFITSM